MDLKLLTLHFIHNWYIFYCTIFEPDHQDYSGFELYNLLNSIETCVPFMYIFLEQIIVDICIFRKLQTFYRVPIHETQSFR